MANMAHVRRGQLAFDPFVGTASILVAMAHFGKISSFSSFLYTSFKLSIISLCFLLMTVISRHCFYFYHCILFYGINFYYFSSSFISWHCIWQCILFLMLPSYIISRFYLPLQFLSSNSKY